jgi:hypothetical protein
MATDRYSFQNIKIGDNKREFVSSFPKIEPSEFYSDSDVFIKIQYGQRIDNLAFQYLGDGKYWWAICLINGLDSPFSASFGQLLRIPISINKIVQILESRST